MELKTVKKIYQEPILEYNLAHYIHSYAGMQTCHDFELDCFLELAKTRNIKTALEIGSFLGLSAIKLNEAVPNLQKMVCVDLWNWKGWAEPHLTHDIFSHFCSNIIHKKIDHKTYVWREDTLVAASQCDEKFDLIFIDAMHDTESVLKDLTHWENHLEADGILCGDDWIFPIGTKNPKQIVHENINLGYVNKRYPVQVALKIYLETRPHLKLNACQNFWWIEK